MNEEQVREIAQKAFATSFGDIDVVCVNVKRGFDHCDDPSFEVTIIYDAEFEQLNGAGILKVRSEIVDKVWGDGKDSPVWPYIHMIAMSDLEEEEDPAMVHG